VRLAVRTPNDLASVLTLARIKLAR
jgi:hypothetical protein